MGNMSYCRIENTFRDLQDCKEALDNKPFEELSESEQKYRNYLVALCKEIADEYDEEEIVENEEEESDENPC